jgi:hypothetical protein
LRVWPPHLRRDGLDLEGPHPEGVLQAQAHAVGALAGVPALRHAAEQHADAWGEGGVCVCVCVCVRVIVCVCVCVCVCV